MRLRRQRAADPIPLLCRWDLDKTYLRSEFETIRQLLRTARERGADKVEVPGVSDLIKGLKAAGERRGGRVLVYFISASPPQIGKAIRDKLALDGVPYDGITFKNQLENIRRGKLRQLREHVGFKLSELLRGRLAAPAGARELLFGDDWESDPLTYSLYADIVAGRLPAERLGPLLGRIGVDSVLMREIAGLVPRAGAAVGVHRILINLEKRTPPAVFQLYGPRLVPTFNYFQTALVLVADGDLDVEDAVRVGRALVDRSGYTVQQLENSFADLVRRGLLSTNAEKLVRRLRAEGVLPEKSRRRSGWVAELMTKLRERQGRRASRPRGLPPVGALDYDTILDRIHPQGRTPTVEARPG